MIGWDPISAQYGGDALYSKNNMGFKMLQRARKKLCS